MDNYYWVVFAILMINIIFAGVFRKIALNQEHRIGVIPWTYLTILVIYVFLQQLDHISRLYVGIGLCVATLVSKSNIGLELRTTSMSFIFGALCFFMLMFLALTYFKMVTMDNT